MQLTKAIGTSDVLIVLDSCEHVVQSAAECVAALLQRCQNVRVLTTSREVLRIAGERVHAVAPLALPQKTLSLPTSSRPRRANCLPIGRPPCSWVSR